MDCVSVCVYHLPQLAQQPQCNKFEIAKSHSWKWFHFGPFGMLGENVRSLFQVKHRDSIFVNEKKYRQNF